MSNKTTDDYHKQRTHDLGVHDPNMATVKEAGERDRRAQGGGGGGGCANVIALIAGLSMMAIWFVVAVL